MAKLKFLNPYVKWRKEEFGGIIKTPKGFFAVKPEVIDFLENVKDREFRSINELKGFLENRNINLRKLINDLKKLGIILEIDEKIIFENYFNKIETYLFDLWDTRVKARLYFSTDRGSYYFCNGRKNVIAISRKFAGDLKSFLSIYAHELTHILLRRSIKISKLDEFKWSLEPFIVNSDVLCVDEGTARWIHSIVQSLIPTVRIKIALSTMRVEMKGKDLAFYIGKNFGQNYLSCIKRYFLNMEGIFRILKTQESKIERKKIIRIVKNSLKNLKNIKSNSKLIEKIIYKPLKYSPRIRFLNSFSLINDEFLNIYENLAKIDAQLAFDFAELFSFYKFDIKNINGKNLERYKKFQNLRKEINLYWKTKRKKKLKEVIDKYNLLRGDFSKILCESSEKSREFL